MYHVVVDLEMNPVARENRRVRQTLKDEVIEIGAVRLDDNYERVGDFQCYVSPEYGEIRPHITKLTGITAEMVAGKAPFNAAFNDFVKWVGEEETVIYSWSMSDLKQLRQECRLKMPDFEVDWLVSRWVDLQKKFDDRLGLHNNLALQHALGAMDHRFQGTQHTALDDAANTSAILALMQDEEEFRRTMQPVLDILQPKTELSTSIGDLYPELNALKNSL
ncbi:MAG: exonuclease domain-containing protein [Selenomonadaceae bacterium]|nr:exonuclease domain-containing protein [Selenomonadaceae bacterium]